MLCAAIVSHGKDPLSCVMFAANQLDCFMRSVGLAAISNALSWPFLLFVNVWGDLTKAQTLQQDLWPHLHSAAVFLFYSDASEVHWRRGEGHDLEPLQLACAMPSPGSRFQLGCLGGAQRGKAKLSSMKEKHYPSPLPFLLDRSMVWS